MGRKFKDDQQGGTDVTTAVETEAPIQSEEGVEVEQVNDGDIAGTAETEAGTKGATEAPEGTEAAKPAEPEDTTEQDKATFLESLKLALAHEGVDADTGTLPTAAIDPVTKAYAGLTGAKLKTWAKDTVTSLMGEAMVAQKHAEARSYMDLFQALKSGPQRETPLKVPVDPTEAYVAQLVALSLAPNFVTVPTENLAEDWQDQLQARLQQLGKQTLQYRDWLFANEGKPAEEQAAAPEGIDELVLQAARVARGRGTAARAARATVAKDGTPKPARKPSTGTRRDIGKHITEAFASVAPGGWLSIGEIVKFESSEYGAGDPPSPGAVAARLFPDKDGSKCTIEGIRSEQRDKKGAVKL